METAVIAGSVAIVVAIIGAWATLKAKRVDLVAGSEGRRADDLKMGYDLVLAAADFAWHCHCHHVLATYLHEPPFDWDEQFPRMNSKFNAMFTSGVDLLKRNSSDFENVSIALQWMYKVIWEGQTLRLLESKPEDYQQTRDMLLYCSRADTRLAQPANKKFWKKISKENSPKKMSDLDADQTLSRANVLLANKAAESFIIQGADSVLAFLEKFDKLPKIFTSSLSMTHWRMQEWSKRGVLDYEGPCTDRQKACYADAEARVQKRKTEEES